MSKGVKVLVAAFLSFSIFFIGIGFAAVSDTLNISGSVTVLKPPKSYDYLYVSRADITTPKTGESVGVHDGSTNLSQPLGWATFTLDFTGAKENAPVTRSVNVDVTNASGSAYLFKELQCLVVGNDSYSPTASVTSGNLNTGTVNSEGEVVDDGQATKIEPYQSINNIALNVTSTVSAKLTLTLNFVFGFAGEADKEEAENKATVKNAVAKLEEALNNSTMFNNITKEMGKNGALGWLGMGNYVGNVVGSQESDTELIEEIFDDTLNSVTFEDNGASNKCTVMIKYENITSSYSGSEMTLYLTTTELSETSHGDDVTVYAVVIAKNSSTGIWAQYGDIYKGWASTNDYRGYGSNSNSFDTGSWRSRGEQTFITIENDLSNKTYTIGNDVTIATAISRYEKRTAVKN